MSTPEVSGSVPELNNQVTSEEPEPNLTSRHLEILSLSSEGLKRRQVADRIHLKDATVRFYINQINKELHVHDITAATLKAIRKGYIAIPGIVKEKDPRMILELTSTQMDVMDKIIAEDNSDTMVKHVAEKMDRARDTARLHLSKIYPKLGVKNKTGAAVFYYYAKQFLTELGVQFPIQQRLPELP